MTYSSAGKASRAFLLTGAFVYRTTGRSAYCALYHYPNDVAALKLLYLVLNNAAEEWRRPTREWVDAKT